MKRPAGVLVAAALAIGGLAIGCRPEPPPRPASDLRYAFFVAGHTYGAPKVDNPGLHAPFVARFDVIRDHPAIELGVFTGDIVIEPTPEDWDDVDRDVARLGVPVYFAPGNHDMRDRELFVERYGPTYYRFTHRGDLFVVLDPNLDWWNISGEQLAFLEEVIAEVASGELEAGNVFVFFHQLLWWAPDNRFRKARPNWKVNRAAEINFWTEVAPLFAGLERPVYMFAGDYGGPMYAREGNLRFVASGMNGSKTDCFVIVEVHEDGAVWLELVALAKERIDGLGTLYEHVP